MVNATNSIGTSVASNAISAILFGQMSIVSVVASGKALTTTLALNGKPIKGVIYLALDTAPNSGSDSGDFFQEITQLQINQAITGTVSVSHTLSGFTTDMAKYAVVAHSDFNSVNVVVMKVIIQ